MKSLALITLAAVLLQTPSDEKKDYILSSGERCPPEGTARSQKVKTLNIAKNRESVPGTEQIDADVSLAVMLAPGEDTDRFDQKRGAAIIGYVIDVRSGGKESCNCDATAPQDMDTHLELALSPKAPPTQRVIIEVTPRLRRQMKAQGIDWSTDALIKKYRGKWVKATGWLLFDFMHVEEAENTNPGGRDNWRATCWEIHPVTRIETLPDRPEQVAEIHPENFTAFHRARVRQLQRNEENRKAVRQGIKRQLEGLSEEELKEIKEERKERDR